MWIMIGASFFFFFSWCINILRGYSALEQNTCSFLEQVYKKRGHENQQQIQSEDILFTPAILTSPNTLIPLIYLSLLELVCALSGCGSQICPLQCLTSKPAQPRSVLCSAHHSFSRLGQGETAERQLLPSVSFGTWPMSDHAARYRRRQTHIWPVFRPRWSKRESKLFLYYT